MLRLTDKPLSAAAISRLKQYQDAVDAKATFPEKAEEGKRLFSKHNKKTDGAFKEVRANLADMSGGTVRCNYCEDSNANQVEHIYPKNYYPERCFSWQNYCYACGPCNQPKSDKFAIFDAATNLEFNLENLLPNTQPQPGTALLIDPRQDEPMDFLFLDTVDTFKFAAFQDDPKEIRRADYTIEILGLNSRSYLVRARKIAFGNFRSRLFEYVHKKEAGASNTILNALADSLKSEHHQSVWHEMIRQRTLHIEIDDLLNRAPEALTWI